MMKGLPGEAVAASVSAGNGDGRRRSDGIAGIGRGPWRGVKSGGMKYELRKSRWSTLPIPTVLLGRTDP
jgi:hypothetical protein